MAHSFLVTGDELHRIEFQDGSWIDIRESVTGVETARWLSVGNKSTTKITGRGKAAVGVTEQRQDIEAITVAKLRAIVVAWSEPIPLDVTKLSQLAVDRIFEEFDNLNPNDADTDQTLGESESPSLPTTE